MRSSTASRVPGCSRRATSSAWMWAPTSAASTATARPPYPCGKISAEAQRLIDVTQQSFFEGIRFAREGQRLSDISRGGAELRGGQRLLRRARICRSRHRHERCTRAPRCPTIGAPGHGPRLLRGMTIAVEPMVNAGGAAVRVDAGRLDRQDRKTVRCAAHYENTILITDGEAGASDASRDLRTCGWTLRRATLF